MDAHLQEVITAFELYPSLTLSRTCCANTLMLYSHTNTQSCKVNSMIPSHSMWQLHMVKDRSMLRMCSYI